VAVSPVSAFSSLSALSARFSVEREHSFTTHVLSHSYSTLENFVVVKLVVIQVQREVFLMLDGGFGQDLVPSLA
jgi:hypothetical protein